MIFSAEKGQEIVEKLNADTAACPSEGKRVTEKEKYAAWNPYLRNHYLLISILLYTANL